MNPFNVSDEMLHKVLKVWMQEIPSIDWNSFCIETTDEDAMHLGSYLIFAFISDFQEAGDLALFWHLVEKEIPTRLNEYKGANPITYLNGLLTASMMMLHFAQQKAWKVKHEL